jgi:DNA-binding transcriptional LysR family regulator
MFLASPRQLQVFVAVASHGGVAAAARALHLSQPAVSMALAECERLLGVALFERGRRRLRLSERGRELLPLAEAALQQVQAVTLVARGAAVAGAAAGPLTGMLRVGASNTVGNYLAGRLLVGFVQAHPGVQVRLRVGNTADIAAALADFALDVACVEGPTRHPELLRVPWSRDRLRVCVRADDPLAKRTRVGRPALARVRWILREPGSAARAQFEQAMAAAGIGVEVALELGQTEAIKQAVLAGLGVACLPEAAIAARVASGELVALPTPFLALERSLDLLLHQRRADSPLLAAFLASARADAGRGLSAAAARSPGRGSSRSRCSR